MGHGALARLRRCGAAILALTALASCSSWAASTGTEQDRITATAHSQVRTTGLVAETALQEPPAPALTLTVVLDEARTELTGLRQELASLSDGDEELLELIDEAVALVGRTQGAVEDGDREALRESRRHADELATELEDRSEPL